MSSTDTKIFESMDRLISGMVENALKQEGISFQITGLSDIGLPASLIEIFVSKEDADRACDIIAALVS